MVLVEGSGRRGGGDGDEQASSSSSSPPASAAVTLAASPENETEVYLEAGALGVEAGKQLALVKVPVLVAAGGGGGGGGGGGSGGAIIGNSLHEPLARAALRTASILARGKLEVYCGLGHLGPFEDPVLIGERAAEAFRRALDVDGGEKGGESYCCGSRCSVRGSNDWDSLPDKTELMSTRARSKL